MQCLIVCKFKGFLSVTEKKRRGMPFILSEAINKKLDAAGAALSRLDSDLRIGDSKFTGNFLYLYFINNRDIFQMGCT